MLILAMVASTTMISFHAGALDVNIDDRGYLTSIQIEKGQNLMPAGHESPILCLRVGGKMLLPTSSRWSKGRNQLTLEYPGHRAVVGIEGKSSHLALELKSVQPSRDVEVAVWGPVATTFRESIGETIGVVQDKGQAFGIQVLNAKTLGGYPNTDDDIEPSYDIFATGNLVDMKMKDYLTDNYRGDTARPTDFGSVVQAYTRNRSQTRLIENWGHKFYTAPAYRDGGVIGSRVALFGCRSTEALDCIGSIEVEEGLPHPMIDGVWGKKSPTARESYLIMGFGVQNLDECLKVTQAAGLRYLYTDGCFAKWGHFDLDASAYPKNWVSMKECVDRARTKGVRLGVHTLSNFITPNDAYVTPVPDRRLAEVGESKLGAGIDAKQVELELVDPKFFNQMGNNTLKTVRVGDELIQYDSVSAQAPWRLLKCKRGAFGTKATAHRAGARIAKLMDHGYQTFLTNAELSKEVAQRIGQLFNETGLLQLSMDGLEGNWSTGMGQYGRTLFTKAWYDTLVSPIKGEVINDASNPGAFNWHIYTRMNWGEPWYAGFRKSQTLYRLKNQRYFKRNLMPGMLGWFQLTSQTTLEDIQWLLARAAGFDAGFCITTSLDAVKHNPNGDRILAAVKAWESARHAHAFGPELLADLQDIEQEFELESGGDSTWRLTPVISHKFTASGKGETTSFDVVQLSAKPRLVLQVPDKAQLGHLEVEFDGKALPVAWDRNHVGYQYIEATIPVSWTGNHRIKVTSDIALDGELRVPKVEQQTLHAKRAS